MQGWPETVNIGGLSEVFVMRINLVLTERKKKNFDFAGKGQQFRLLGGCHNSHNLPVGPALSNTIRKLKA